MQFGGVACGARVLERFAGSADRWTVCGVGIRCDPVTRHFADGRRIAKPQVAHR